MGAQVPQVDSTTVADARRGDTAAHGRLYETLAPMVYTLARRMLISPTLAEDVLQETFVEVLRKLHTFRGEAGIGFWVRRIAVNKCLMHLRSGWHSRRVDTEAIEALCPPAQAPRAEHQIALERALAELTDTSRAVVWLHDVEGYTHKEIGAMMGRTASFSKSRLARAHQRLRVLLEGERSKPAARRPKPATRRPAPATERPEDGGHSCTPALKTC